MLHGIKTNLLVTGARTISAAASAVIGLVGTAPDAAAADFPLDTAVPFTDVRRALASIGATGTLPAALEAINDQVSPQVVLVRVAADADAADQDDLVVGNIADYSGMQALLAAEARTGLRPRIIGAPGLDNQAVTTALAIVAARLRGRAYARAVGDTIADVLTYRALFAQRELSLIWPDWTSAFPGDAVARALGMRALIDETEGWHKTLSNVAVAGVSGISKDLFFDIQDETTDVSTLNAAGIVTMVRLPTGFVFWGNRTCAETGPWAFESAVRTSQILQDEIANGLIWAVDKPLTARLVKDMLETINARFRTLTVGNRLIGARAWFDPALNSETDLAAGKLVIDYDFTPAAPLEGLTLNQRITDRYYRDFAAQIAA